MTRSAAQVLNAISFRDHRAQRMRLDFGRIYEAYGGEIPFLVGGSDEDPFEHRQVTLAQERLGGRGLTIAHLPGGHLTTNEQPQAFAQLIQDFYDRTASFEMTKWEM